MIADETSIDQIAINTIRFLAIDMVEQARSGHPGAPMGQAPLAYVLWTSHLRHNPANPAWANRDRFVLSCGHASALLYSLLHLSGYDLPLDELRDFRQLHSKTPGHPEYGHTVGVETTTGPLGQGLGNAVGMAIAQRLLAARFNRPGGPIFDHRTWVIASDGDLMEGVASEASSLAGHLGLGSLNVFYDDNEISIDGPTSLTYSEDVGKRYEAYGWHVQTVEDGNDIDELDGAAAAAALEEERPSLVIVKTHIGYGSPNKQDTADAHGAPLGPEEAELTRQALGWPADLFHVPEEAREAFAEVPETGAHLESEWNEMVERYRREHPEAAAELEAALAGELPNGWEEQLPTFSAEDGPLATRKASGAVLSALQEVLPQLTGGSADLTPSNNTYLSSSPDQSSATPDGRNLRFGVREHAMGSVLNGIALSGMFLPYAGTFLIFSDYMRPPIRLAALMGLQVIYVFTHDSIFLGEDGPTHQPVSQLLALRAIPGLTLFRPADARETVEAWRLAIADRSGPTVLALTRQKLPILDETDGAARAGVERGAYVLADADDPAAILIATGSEVELALAARAALAEKDIHVRVVSMPSWERFDAQDTDYRDSVLPPAIQARLAIEAGIPLGWERYVGDAGDILGVPRFGASARYKDLAPEYGFTVEEVVRRVEQLLP